MLTVVPVEPVVPAELVDPCLCHQDLSVTCQVRIPAVPVRCSSQAQEVTMEPVVPEEQEVLEVVHLVVVRLVVVETVEAMVAKSCLHPCLPG